MQILSFNTTVEWAKIFKWFISSESLPGSVELLIKWLQLSYHPNSGDELKLFTVFRKDGMGVDELLVCLKRWRRLSRLRRRFPPSLQISACWNPLFLQMIFKFCHIHSLEIGSNFAFCHPELFLFLNVELISQNFPLVIPEVTKSQHNTIPYEIPCGNQGLLTSYSDSWVQISYETCVYLTIYALVFLEIPDQVHHCKRVEPVWLFHAGTFPATFFASTLALAKYQLAWWIIKHMIQKRDQFWARNASRPWK